MATCGPDSCLPAFLACLLALTACTGDETAEAFDMPEWMDVDFSGEVPAYDGLLDEVELSFQQCGLLEAATAPLPFGADPETVGALAGAYDELGLAVSELGPVTITVAATLRTAADRGADRQAMIGLWFDRAGIAALRELSTRAMSHCQGDLRPVAFGLPDRIIELAGHDHPDSTRIEDIASWSMSITSEPELIYCNFGCAGHEPLMLCEELVDTLESAGFTGTHVTVHDADLEDQAEGDVGDSCHGA